MSVDRFQKKKWATLAVFLFLNFLYSASFPLDAQEQARPALDIKREGIEHYMAGQYAKAIATFEQIFEATGEKALLSQAHLYISMSHYCMEEYEKAKKSLDSSLEIMPEIDSAGLIFPPGYDSFFQEAKTAKYGPQKEKEIKEPVVRTAGGKRASKKMPVLLIAGAAVGAGILVAVLVLGKKKPANIQVNSTPPGAQVFMDGTDTGKTTNCILEDVTPGSHTLRLVKDGYVDFNQSVNVVAGETAMVNATLTPNTITILSPTASTVWYKGGQGEIKWQVSGSAAARSDLISLSEQRLLARDLRVASARGAAGRDIHDDRRAISPDRAGENPGRPGSPARADLNRTDRFPVSGQSGPPGPSGAIFSTGPVFGRSGPKTEGFSAVFPQDIAKVKIELYKGTSLITPPIIEITSSAGTYTWTVPMSLANGTDYKIRISCSTASEVYKDSPSFTIGDPVGSIQVNSTPTGAKVYLDGTDSGKTTNCTLTNVSPGSHTVKVSKDGYVDHSVSVNVTAGQTTTVTASLSKYSIVVSAPAANAHVRKNVPFNIQWLASAATPVQEHQEKAASHDLNTDSGRPDAVSMGEETDGRILTITQVRIELWKGSAKQSPDIAATRPYSPGTSGSFPWTPATSLADGSDYRVRVVASGTTSDGSVYGQSSAFTLMHWYDYMLKWGSNGSGPGQFKNPWGLAVDGSGNIYVADIYNHRIQRFTSSGVYVNDWGSYGSWNGQFNYPRGLAVDGSGNVYVADTNNHRIQRFTSSGVYATKWGSNGSGNGQFNSPRGLAVDGSGNVYVADSDNHRIQRFTSSGVYATKWGSQGSGNGQFNYPYGIAVDGSGNVYVVEPGNHRIQKFTSTGVFITKWGSYGSGDGQFNYPYGIAVDGSGNVYVADSSNHRIQKFTSTGVFVTKWGSYGSGDGQFNNPYGIAVDGSGNVYVSEYRNHRVQKFRKIG